MSKQIAILAVVGSVTPPGRLRRAVAAALERAGARPDMAVRLLDLAEFRISFADGRPPAEMRDDTALVIEAIAAADAVLLATPVYRGSLTGALKNLLDNVPVEALEGKPVGIAAMGATAHHFLGAETHTRDILAWFGALVAPVAVYLTSADFDDGVPSAGAGAALDGLISELVILAAARDVDRRPLLRPLAANRGS